MNGAQAEKVAIEILTGDPLAVNAAGVIVGVWDDGQLAQDLKKKIDAALGGELARILANGEFKGETGETFFLPTFGKMKSRYLILAGLGKRDKTTAETLRKLSGTVAGAARRRNLPTIHSTLTENISDSAQAAEAVVEGTLLGLYLFSDYKSKPENGSKAKSGKNGEYVLTQLSLQASKGSDRKVRQGVEWGQSIVRATYLARDLGNQPANVATPTMIAETASRETRKRGIRYTSFDRTRMEEMGLGALVGVAKGSNEPARLIQLEYKPAGAANTKPVLLVGKTLTFDSGGISLKPAEKMETMKGDMSGGATVLGTMMAASDLKLPLWIVGLMPATENMPSGTANKPGDVLRAFNGKTIEVINTDAEGRLILADALSYGIKTFEPMLTIDLATLTGAVTVALGAHTLGVMGNDQKRIDQILETGTEVGERGWQLPLFEEYYDQIKSPVADIQNVGGRGAGTITAAAFLSHFVDDKPWVHLDIAGTAWVESDEPYKPKGNVGIGIRLLTHFLNRLAAEKGSRKRPEKPTKRK
jgi:leucyl aminopeptidase